MILKWGLCCNHFFAQSLHRHSYPSYLQMLVNWKWAHALNNVHILYFTNNDTYPTNKASQVPLLQSSPYLEGESFILMFGVSGSSLKHGVSLQSDLEDPLSRPLLTELLWLSLSEPLLPLWSFLLVLSLSERHCSEWIWDLSRGTIIRMTGTWITFPITDQCTNTESTDSYKQIFRFCFKLKEMLFDKC